MRRLPDPTLRNALVTPLLFVRVPILFVGRTLLLLGVFLEWVGDLIPAWTDDQRKGRA
jgi:hypothetical protein